MRVVAGQWRGRRLEGPRGPGVRPTSDSLRETLFNILQTEIPGAVFVDAFGEAKPALHSPPCVVRPLSRDPRPLLAAGLGAGKRLADAVRLACA